MQNEFTNTHSRRPRPRQAKVLIVDDNPDHLTLIDHYLKQCLPEVEAIRAVSEEAAIAYLSDCTDQEWKLPRLILLDLYMPLREDGWRILERIKALPTPGNQIPVVVLSYSDKSEDIRETYDRGGSSYLVKPIHLTDWLTQFQALRTYWWDTVKILAGVSFALLRPACCTSGSAWHSAKWFECARSRQSFETPIG